MQMLENLKTNLSRFTPDQKTILILVCILFFIGISVYIYKTQIQPKILLKNEDHDFFKIKLTNCE